MSRRKVTAPLSDRLAHERRRYLRGAEGEVYVGWLLDGLPDQWHAFHGVQLQEGHDLDHVVVGPGGLYYVSTKSWRGLFSQDAEGRLLYNNKPTDAAVRALRDGIELRERLNALTNSEQWVHVVLAVPFGWVDVRGR